MNHVESHETMITPQTICEKCIDPQVATQFPKNAVIGFRYVDAQDFRCPGVLWLVSVTTIKMVPAAEVVGGRSLAGLTALAHRKF